MLAALTILSVGIAAGGPGRADGLPETHAVDAQIAPGIVDKRASSPVDRPRQARIHALIPEAEHNCLPLGGKAATGAQRDLEATIRQTRKSAIGAWLLETATARGVIVCIDTATELEAHYRSHLRLLGLNAKLNPAGRVVFLAHELAHVPQHPHFSNNRRFPPEDMLLLQRVREAAAEAVATRVLWQLRIAGINAPWQEKLRTAYHDIAQAFEATMGEDRGTARELWATRAAFHRWFEAGWRRDIYDDLMLNTLARIAVDPIGLVPPSRHLSEDYLRSIADYAGQRFLVGGDGRALIEDFQFVGLAASSRARLDAILAHASADERALEAAADDISASSTGPVPATGD